MGETYLHSKYSLLTETRMISSLSIIRNYKGQFLKSMWSKLSHSFFHFSTLELLEIKGGYLLFQQLTIPVWVEGLLSSFKIQSKLTDITIYVTEFGIREITLMIWNMIWNTSQHAWYLSSFQEVSRKPKLSIFIFL